MTQHLFLWQVTDADKLLFEMPGGKTLFKKDWQQETHTGIRESSGPLQCISLKDEATRAELIWAMKVVSSH